MKFHTEKEVAGPNQVYVFGSALSGNHELNFNAKQATLKYGAKFGRGIGVSGMSYAIPVRGYDNELLSLDSIEQYVKRFVKFSKMYPTINFFITRIGCNKFEYSDAIIAPLFNDCGDNCSLPNGFKKNSGK